MTPAREMQDEGRFLVEKSPGNIEYYGYSAVIGGLVVLGWFDTGWRDKETAAHVTLVGPEAELDAAAAVFAFRRPDIAATARGFILVLDSPERAFDTLLAVRIVSPAGVVTHLFPHANPLPFDEENLLRQAAVVVPQAQPSPERDRLLTRIERPRFAGHDTLGPSGRPVHVDIDKIYFCPPHGLLIVGWLIDPFAKAAVVRFRCGDAVCLLDRSNMIRTPRPDVVSVFADRYANLDVDCGVIAFVPSAYRPELACYLEFELLDGSVLFRPLATSLYTGLPAIKEIAYVVTLRGEALEPGYDKVVGPALHAMNSHRLRTPPRVTTTHFGARPASVRCSLIIPLYGRIDFLEYQLALIGRTLGPDIEIIVVLDDPERETEATALAVSAYARFRRPFSLLALSHNVGYAPASNIGLAAARGDHVCFLNSDVFPDGPGWLESMIAILQGDAGIGVVGARLVYEDGTLQHDGCTFERLDEFGNWPFPMHPGKGRRVLPKAGSTAVAVVTGACMVMPRALATDLGGFNEDFIIGDFEDADLCLRIGARGLRCVVDHGAQLFHLERQSQNLQAGPWRMNVTLYNAWRFKTLWSDHVF